MLTPATTVSLGIVVLVVLTIAYGGTFLLRVSTGTVPTNELQRNFYRAGHAHAGVLVTLGLLVQVLLAAAAGDVPAWADTLASGVLWAAILMPAGFFLSVVGKEPARPNGLRVLIWLGAASLAVGLVAAGVGLVLAGLGA